MLLFTTCLSSEAQNVDPTQIYQTGNIVIPTTTSSGSTWTGAIYQNSLTCWQWGDPGYCGPNAIVRPGGNFNFSYGSTYVYQEQSVASILTAAGLRVNGYNFGFTAKNGNGWDNGMTDQLTALVRFWDTTGGRGTSNLLYGNSYNLSYKYNWTTFNFSENFTNPLKVTDIGKVQYGFIGRDNNGWAGPYGPEIQNVNFSLKYSVDPCSVDPRSSPSCPGYLSYVMSLVPTSTGSTSPTTATVTTVTTESSAPIAPTTSDTSSNSTSNPTTAAPSASATVTATTSSTPSAPQVAAQDNTKSTNGTSIGLSVIAKNKEKETAIANQAVSAAVTLATSASQAAQEQSVSVATTQAQQSVALTDSIAASTNNLYSLSSQQTSGIGFNVQMISGPQSQTTVLLAPVTVIEDVQQSAFFKIQEASQFSNQQIEVNQIQSNMLVDRTNPLNSLFDAPLVIDSQQQSSSSAVKKDVQPNEVAGGVDITNIAMLPTGYNSYLTLVLKDSSFYAPRDIYPRQNTVDNVRALRQLSSDRVHQEMVNQQYKGK